VNSVSWITSRRTVRSIATPNEATAWQLWTVLTLAGFAPRLWQHNKKNAPMLLI
jgi:hypothetical protein